MIILFFFFICIIIIIIIGIAIHTSRLGIDIENLIINTQKPKGQKINKESKIYVYLLIFGKIKLFKKDAKKMKQPNVKIENRNIDIDLEILKKNDIKINYKELLQNIDINIKKININAQIGTQDAALTAILVGILSSILGVILKKPKYQINPIYSDKNVLNIKIECIISIYLMQYIYRKIWGHCGDRYKICTEKMGKHFKSGKVHS